MYCAVRKDIRPNERENEMHSRGNKIETGYKSDRKSWQIYNEKHEVMRIGWQGRIAAVVGTVNEN